MALPPPNLPPAASAAFHELSEEEQQAFVSAYNSRSRSIAAMMALAILFPIQLFFLGRILLGILFVLTGGGFLIWYVIEWFLTPGRVRDYNTKVATEVIGMVKVGGEAAPAETDDEPDEAEDAPAETEEE